MAIERGRQTASDFGPGGFGAGLVLEDIDDLDRVLAHPQDKAVEQAESAQNRDVLLGERLEIGLIVLRIAHGLSEAPSDDIGMHLSRSFSAPPPGRFIHPIECMISGSTELWTAHESGAWAGTLHALRRSLDRVRATMEAPYRTPSPGSTPPCRTRDRSPPGWSEPARTR